MPVLWGTQVRAQNNVSNQMVECIPTLPADFNFLKSFKINEENSANGKLEYSYTFARDTQYIINLCNKDIDKKGIIITLYDFQRHKLVTSKIKGKYLSTIIFNCKTTGIYYITYTFDNAIKFYGQSILGFKKIK